MIQHLLSKNYYRAILLCAIILFPVILPVSLYAQEGITVIGFIMDSNDNQPLPGANILVKRLDVKEAPFGTASSSNGYYHISGLVPGRYSFRYSYIGYQTRTDTLAFTSKDQNKHITHTVRLVLANNTMNEVVVSGVASGATDLEAGRQSVSPIDLAHVSTPSVSGDLASYLQTLPSVVSVGDRGGELFIRGGTPDQNLVLMDKIPIYRPFHIVGFYSAFPQDLISSAKIYAGGFPAEYNGVLSSVIDVSMRGGNKNHFEGSGTIGPFLTGLHLEGPLNKKNGLSILTEGRFSQIERTAPVFLGEDEPIKFNDQFAKLQSANQTSRVSVTAIHTYDRGKIDPQRNDVFEWENYAIGTRFVSFQPSTLTLVDLNISTSYVTNAVGQGSNPARRASLWHLNTDVDLVTPLKGGIEIDGGFHGNFNAPKYSLAEEFQGVQSGNNFLIGLTAYGGLKIPFGRNINVNPSVSLVGSFDYPLEVEPRLRASWRPFGVKTDEISAAFGLYRQTIVGLTDERDLGSAFMAWVPAPLKRKRPYALHAILGWKQQMGHFGFTAEGYYKKMGDLAVPIWSTIARFTTQLASANGTVYGFDLRGEFNSGPVYAYLGYGYSWTMYYSQQDNFGTWFGTNIESYHPPFDQRNSITALLSFNFKFAVANIRWQFASGLPYTQPFGFDSYIPLGNLQDPRNGYGTPRLLYDKPYQARLPAYNRLDISLEHTFQFKSLSLVAKGGAINFYDRKNLFYVDLYTLRRINQLPLVPYIAIEMKTR